MNSAGTKIGIQWPPVADRRAAALLAMQFSLERTQQLSSETIKQQQFVQLAQVARHAKDTVSFYRDRLDGLSETITSETLREVWDSIPILTRTDVQEAGASLHSDRVPQSHGKVHALLTSGATGQPVKCLGTQITQFFWRSITIRDHLWHRRDFSKKLAAIRYTRDTSAAPPDGAVHDNWGEPVCWISESGSSTLLTTDSTVTQQADWLRKHDPAYLIAYPSNVKALARRFLDRGWSLPSLLHVRSFGEILEKDVRDLCRRAWNVPVIDCYSSQEVGYLALECPDEPGVYHIQAEAAYVEILDDQGEPCVPGAIGRVVVSTMHNAAMPLIRYDLGDYAEVGAACACGRGLPTLKRIVGRQRNMLTYPSGEQRWPSLGDGTDLEGLPNIRQFQIAQVALDKLEVRLALREPFDAEQEDQIVEHVRRTLGHPFRVDVRYLDEIPRSPSGKFEEFRSEL